MLRILLSAALLLLNIQTALPQAQLTQGQVLGNFGTAGLRPAGPVNLLQFPVTANGVPIFNGTTGQMKDSGIPGNFDQPASYPSIITFGHRYCALDADCQFGNSYSQYPFGVVSTNPLIIGKSGSTIGSSTVGQTFRIVFTSTGLAGSPITKTYTAIGGDTTTTIAVGLCALVHADPVLHGTGGKPIFCQSLGAGVFNLQYDAAFAATGATPLTTATTGSTGTINLAVEQNAFDFISMQLGRNVPGRAGRTGDALYALDFTGQDSTGVFNTHYGILSVTAAAATAGATRGSFIFSTAGNAGPIGRVGMGTGMWLYDAAGALPAGGDQGPGTISLPASGFFSVGASSLQNAGAFTANVFGGSAVGSTLNLQSTQNGSPSGDFVQITAGGVVGYKYTGAATTITSPTIVLRGVSGSSPVSIGQAGIISGSLVIAGASSGATTVQPAATAAGTLTLPARTGTLALNATATTQVFTSGTDATYTTPANVTWLEIEYQGGGGGGAGSGTTPGAAGAGGNTCWRASGTACTTPLYQASGGTAGLTNGATAAGGGVAGSLTCNDSQTGGTGGAATGVLPSVGAAAGISRYGSAGPVSGISSVGVAAIAGSGSGGSGAGSAATANSGGGGGAGGWCYAIIAAPAATYTYTIGAAGAAGGAGTGGVVGGAGAAGKIRVIEHYN